MSLSPFALAAPSLIGMGYSPIPIAPRCDRTPLFEGDRPPEGKTPGRFKPARDGTRYWFGFKQWKAFCKQQAHPSAITDWASWPDAGVGVCCGYGGLLAIDVDNPDLIEPIRAILPPILVEKFGRKGFTAFYRSEHSRADEEWWKKKNYKNADKRGLLDFLAAGSQTVVPPSPHKDGGHYVWTTERTLLNTPPEALPLFTDEHREAMEEVLRRYGWPAPEPAKGSSKAVTERPVRKQSAAIVGGGWWARFLAEVKAARLQWVPKLGLHRLEQCPEGWKSVASFRPSSSGKPLAERNQNLWIYDSGPIKDYSGPRDHNDISLVAVCLFGSSDNTKQAIAWLREEIGFDDSPAVIEPPAAPTYEDNRLPIDEALKSLGDVFGDGFKDAILASRSAREARAAFDALDANDPARRRKILLPYDHPVEIIPTETGLGKTRTAREALTSLAKLGFKFAYAVPYHELADDVAADFRAEGMEKKSVEVYRAYDRPDPRAPKKHKMCRRPEEYEAVRALGISPHSAICEIKPDLVTIRCPHASHCGLMRQRDATPDIWIVPNALLFTPKPAFFPEIDALVIDEGFIDNAIGVPFEFDVQAHKAPIDKDLYNPAEHDKLTLFRGRLRDAIKENGGGPLSRAALLAQGINCETAGWLSELERRPLDEPPLSPDMLEQQIRSAANKFKAKAIQARNASTMWETIEDFLGEHSFEDFYGDRSLSGRLTVGGSKLLVRPFRPVQTAWRDAPLAYLDATPPPTRLVELALGEVVTYGLPSPVRREPEITATWSTHVRVRQILGGPSKMTEVGVGSWAKEKAKREEEKAKQERRKTRPEKEKTKVTEIVSYIQLQAALAYPARVGVVTFKELRERIAKKLPDNIEWMHYGAVAGRNNMEEVTGLIVLGRLSAQRRDVEALASVFAGYPISGDSNWFENKTGGIRMANGMVQGVHMEWHRDPIAEAVRWLITEGNLIQAIGRLRPHRREAPCWVDIITDVPLPITVDETVQWGDVKPGAVGAMALTGVVLTNVSDA